MTALKELKTQPSCRIMRIVTNDEKHQARNVCYNTTVTSIMLVARYTYIV